MTTIELLRQYRIGDYAIFDFTTAYLGMALLSPLLSKLFRKLGFDIPKRNWIFLTLPIAIVTHLLIRTITPLTRYFFDLHAHYWVKLAVVISLILGLRGIRRIKK